MNRRTNESGAAAELAWPGNGDDGPASVSGTQHLMEHAAHDMGLSERDEIAFRQWFTGAAVHGFDRYVKKAEVKV